MRWVIWEQPDGTYDLYYGRRGREKRVKDGIDRFTAERHVRENRQNGESVVLRSVDGYDSTITKSKRLSRR